MDEEPSNREKWQRAYDDMMVRVRTALEEAGESTPPVVRKVIDRARHTAVELEELTHDEADRIAAWLQRDIEDAGRHLAETGRELGDWLRFDVDQVEDRLLEVFSRVADRTRLEFLQFQHDIEEGPAWNAGEITGPGTLVCDSCGALLHFHATGEIPACPNCGHGVFHRQHAADTAT